MLVTKYGTLFGHAPLQMGSVIFVAPAASYTINGDAYSASDDNSGLSPFHALLTISQAQTVATANVGDTVILLEGTHALTATLRLNKAGVTYLGVRSPSTIESTVSPAFGLPPKTIVSFAGAAAPGLSIEADNIEIAFVTLRPAPGFGTVIFRNADPDGLYLHDFAIDFTRGAPGLTTNGIDFGYRADTAGLAGTSMSRLRQSTQRATAYLANFSILSGGAYGPGIITATADVTVVNGRFHNRAGAWATPFAVATGTGYVFIKGCTWTAQGTTGIGTCLDGTNSETSENSSGSKQFTNNKVAAHDCRFTAPAPVGPNSPVDNWPTGVISLTECYQGNNNLTAVGVGLFASVATPFQTISSV